MARGTRGARLVVRGLLVLSVVGLLAALLLPDAAISEEPDIIEAGWYRSAHSRALVRLPSLDPEWSIQSPKPGRLVLRWNRSGVAGEITLVVQAPEEFAATTDDGAALAERLAGLGAASIKRSLSFLVSSPGRRLDRSDGIDGYEIDLAGTLSGNDVLEQRIWVLAQGKQVASVVTVGRGSSSTTVAAIASTMVANLRIGARVPRLVPRVTRTPLAGVYVGPIESGVRAWRVFDPRGYSSDRPPVSGRTADLEALYQTSDVPPLSTYDVTDGVLELRPLAPDSVPSKTRISVAPGKIDLGGHELVRVDGSRGSRLIDGSYFMRETPTVHLRLSKDGTFHHEDARGVATGTYAIVGDRIRFTWPGHADLRTLYTLGDSIFVGAVEFLPER